MSSTIKNCNISRKMFRDKMRRFQMANQAIVVIILLVARLGSLGGELTPQQPALNRSFELKFQTELEDSATFKYENQHQIFKCQVKLAQIQAAHKANANARLQSSISKLSFDELEDFHKNQSKNANDATHSKHPNPPPPGPHQWPSNVGLTIDWFRNNRPLLEWLHEANQAISIINIELQGRNNSNSNSSSNSNKNRSNDKKSITDKHQRASSSNNNNNNNNTTTKIKGSRYEIKNTLNRAQFKLNSRLKINQLRADDSGQFKCIARVNFTLGANGENGSNLRGIQSSQQSASGQHQATATMTSATNSILNAPPDRMATIENNTNISDKTTRTSSPGDNSIGIESNKLDGERSSLSSNAHHEIDNQQSHRNVEWFRHEQSLESKGSILIVTPNKGKNKSGMASSRGFTGQMVLKGQNQLESSRRAPELNGTRWADENSKSFKSISQSILSSIFGKSSGKVPARDQAYSNDLLNIPPQSPNLNVNLGATPLSSPTTTNGKHDTDFHDTTQSQDDQSTKHDKEYQQKDYPFTKSEIKSQPDNKMSATRLNENGYVAGHQTMIIATNGTISKVGPTSSDYNMNRNEMRSQTSLDSYESSNRHSKLSPINSHGVGDITTSSNPSESDEDDFFGLASSTNLESNNNNNNQFSGDSNQPNRHEHSTEPDLFVDLPAHDNLDQDSSDRQTNVPADESVETLTNGLANKGTTVGQTDFEDDDDSWKNIWSWPSTLIVQASGGASVSDTKMKKDGYNDYANTQDIISSTSDQDKLDKDNKSSMSSRKITTQIGKESFQTDDNLQKQSKVSDDNGNDVIVVELDEQMANKRSNGANKIQNRNPNPIASSTLNQNDDYFWDPNKSKFVKFFHTRMLNSAETLASCYMSLGEHYAGNVSISRDNRVCLNWIQVSRLLIDGHGLTTSLQPLNGKASNYYDNAIRHGLNKHFNHNYCRNPNMNGRGPWCYVQYSEELDGRFSLTQRDAGHNNFLFVAKECNISPCSRYLWLYIVAPPLGLLTLLLVALVISVKSMQRRSYYRSCLRKMSKAVLPVRFHKISVALGTNNSGRSSYNCHRHRHHLSKQNDDEEPFEIINDTEWRDCQSLSPKSSTASYAPFQDHPSKHLIEFNNNNIDNCRKNKMNNRANYQRSKSHLQLQYRNGLLAKPTPYSNEKLLDISTSTTTTDFTGRSSSSGSNSDSGNNSASASPRTCNQQSGPIFATLRCQLKNTLSSTINHREQPNTTSHYATCRRKTGNVSGKHDNKHSMNYNNSINNKQSTDIAYNQTQKLISCSTTLDDIEPICMEDDHRIPETIVQSNISYKRAIQLPQIDSTSVSIGNNSQELLFEGKFSQVSCANWRRLVQYKSSDKQSPEDEFGERQAPSRDIGLSIAVHSLKSAYNGGAMVDSSLFDPMKLSLRDLNHLNLIKLIGCMIEPVNADPINHDRSVCSLIYDMSQLVDFVDWLKQQNKDLMVASEIEADESSNQSIRLRRNLSCLAKQIALALDYLHDQDIIYQDLACRNCFIDPTKMLVKLASFNIEPVIPTNQLDDLSSPKLTSTTRSMQQDSLKSMIRPKYLIDYYVIDSRPSGSQMQPLSWIPLESILFNKFNKQTDIWSFGCLLYEIFSLGEVAYFGYSSKQIIDSVRANVMPPQPSLCPNGIYRLMCNCLSDIPTIRPNIKLIYEQLNLFSGQCSSFLDHHLCSLNTMSSKMEHMAINQHIQNNVNHK